MIQARDEALAQLASRRVPDPPAVGTVAEWIAQWLASVGARSDRSPATYANYESVCRNHITPAIGNLRLTELASSDIAQMLDGKTPAIRHLAHRAMSVAWLEAWRAQKVLDKDLVLRVPRLAPAVRGASPMDGTDYVTAVIESMNATEPRAREGLRASDQAAVLRILEDDRLRARWLLGMVYGLRQSEVLGLGWPDLVISGQGATLSIRRSRVRQDWAHGCTMSQPCGKPRSRCPERVPLPTVKAPKTLGSGRMIHLSPGMLAILLDWRSQQAAESVALRINPEIPWMFTNRRGEPLSHSKDNKDWQDVLQAAHVSRHYSLHDLRHTAASEAAATPGIDLPALMGMFGWTRRQTVETYAHARDDRIQRAWQLQEERFLPRE